MRSLRQCGLSLYITSQTILLINTAEEYRDIGNKKKSRNGITRHRSCKEQRNITARGFALPLRHYLKTRFSERVSVLSLTLQCPGERTITSYSI